MMNENISVTSSKRKFNASNISTCGGFLRGIIAVVGFLTIILGSIGSPHDLSSKNPNPKFNDPEDYYGYGLGYIKEPLNVTFIVCIVLAWLFEIGFLIALCFQGSHKMPPTLNRLLYCLFGLLIIGGAICGGVGTYFFWEGCCNILPSQQCANNNSPNLQYYEGAYSKEHENYWCRCTFMIQQDDDDPSYIDQFVYDRDDLTLMILAAWPHHLLVRSFALAIASLNGILHFVAVCIT